MSNINNSLLLYLSFRDFIYEKPNKSNVITCFAQIHDKKFEIPQGTQFTFVGELFDATQNRITFFFHQKNKSLGSVSISHDLLFKYQGKETLQW